MMEDLTDAAKAEIAAAIAIVREDKLDKFIRNHPLLKVKEPDPKDPPKIEPPKVEPPKVEPPKVEPPKVEPPKVEPPPPPAPGTEPPAKKRGLWWGDNLD